MLTNPSLNTERGMGKKVVEITWYLMTSLYFRGGSWGGGLGVGVERRASRDLGQIKMGRGEGSNKGGIEAAFAEYFTHHNSCFPFIYIAHNIMYGLYYSETKSDFYIVTKT